MMAIRTYIFPGFVVLRPPLAVEKLGSRQDTRVNDGFRYRCRPRCGETTKEAFAAGLPRRQSEAP